MHTVKYNMEKILAHIIKGVAKIYLEMYPHINKKALDSVSTMMYNNVRKEWSNEKRPNI